MKTGVLVHGFNLHAENWENIVWGKPPFFLGRVPKGVLVALEEKADIMVFGTGASEKDGKKEAEYTRNYLVEHFSELAKFSAFRNIILEEAKKIIGEISKLELKSQNTVQEISYAGEIFKEVGVGKIILVSSPAHSPRCLRDALAIIDGLDISVRPSQTSWGDIKDVIVLEPPSGPMRRQKVALIVLRFLLKKLYRFPNVDKKK